MSNQTVQIRLADGEKRLLDYQDELVVTNRRIRHATTGPNAQLSVVSMMIDDLRSAEFGKRSYPSLLGLSGVVFGVGGYMGEEAFLILGVLSAVLVGAYFLTRKVVLELKSATATIALEMNGSKAWDAYEFIDNLEQIRHDRILQRERQRS